jgi:hypothetical protein
MDHPEDRVALIEVLDRDGRVRRTVDLHRWPVTLGRALDNTVVLDDPHVAAWHATLAPDAAGQLQVQVGDSVNGVLLGATALSLPAGTSAALPLAGALLQLGSQRLRLRLPGEALDDERVFTRPVVAAGPALLGVAAAWFALQGGLRWVDLDPGADFTQWLPWLLGLPIGLAVWCGLWALGSRLFRHGFDFIGHAAIALPILLAIELVDLALPAIAGGLGWPLLWHLHKLLAPPLLVAWLLRAHLRQLLPLRGRAIDTTLALLVIGGVGVGVALNQRQQGRVFADPYMRTLPMPMLRLGAPQATAQIGAAMAPLRGTLAERVRQAAEDQPEDGDSPP